MPGQIESERAGVARTERKRVEREREGLQWEGGRKRRTKEGEEQSPHTERGADIVSALLFGAACCSAHT